MQVVSLSLLCQQTVFCTETSNNCVSVERKTTKAWVASIRIEREKMLAAVKSPQRKLVFMSGLALPYAGGRRHWIQMFATFKSDEFYCSNSVIKQQWQRRIGRARSPPLSTYSILRTKMTWDHLGTIPTTTVAKGHAFYSPHWPWLTSVGTEFRICLQKIRHERWRLQ